MVAVLALAVMPLLFAQIVPPPQLGWAQSWQAHSPLAPCPAPDAQLGGPSLVRPAPLKCCTWVQSCQAHSFLAPFSALGAPVRWGYPPPPSAPPCSSWQWQAQSCQACPRDALRVGPVLSGPLLPRPVFCVGRTGTVGIPPPPCLPPPCSSWRWQAQSCHACPSDALQVGRVLSGPLLPRPVSCAGRTSTVGIPPPPLSALPCSFRRWQAQSCQAGPPVALRVGPVLPGPLLHCAVPRAGRTLPFLPPPLCGCQPLNCGRVQSCQARHPLPRAQCRRAGTRGGHGLPPLCPGLAPEPAPLTGPLYGGLTCRFRGAPAGLPACWLPATAPPTRAVGGWQGTPPPPLLSTSVAVRAQRALALQRARTGAAGAVRRRAPPSGAAAGGCFERHCAAAPVPHSLRMGG